MKKILSALILILAFNFSDAQNYMIDEHNSAIHGLLNYAKSNDLSILAPTVGLTINGRVSLGTSFGKFRDTELSLFAPFVNVAAIKQNENNPISWINGASIQVLNNKNGNSTETSNTIILQSSIFSKTKIGANSSFIGGFGISYFLSENEPGSSREKFFGIAAEFGFLLGDLFYISGTGQVVQNQFGLGLTSGFNIPI